MSASYDKSQRFKYVYSNMYKIYKSGEPHELVGPHAIPRSRRHEPLRNSSAGEPTQLLFGSITTFFKKFFK